MFLNNFTLMFINMIHFLVILFIIIIPFTNYTLLILIHSIIVPFIMAHWLLNNDNCAITELEKIIRIKINGNNPVNYNDCFSYKIISPVYNFISLNPNHSDLSWAITIIIWIFSLYRLYDGRENLKKIFNRIKIKEDLNTKE